MSDNLATSKQAAAAQDNKSANDTMAAADGEAQLQAAAEIHEKDPNANAANDRTSSVDQDDDGNATKKAGAVSTESHCQP